MKNQLFTTMSKGFTLIELLTVIAILGILTGVGFPVYIGYKDQANKNVTQNNLNDLLGLMKTKMLECEAKSSIELMSTQNSKRFNKISCTTGTGYLTSYFVNHMFNAGYRNPYLQSEPAIVCCGQAYNKGQTYIGVGGNNPSNSAASWWFRTKISDKANEDVSSRVTRASRN